MRIAIFTPNYPGLTGEGGIGSYTRTLAHGLSALGHTIHVLTPGRQTSTNDGPVRVHFTQTDYLPGIDKIVPGAGACWRIACAMQRLVRDYNLNIVEFPNWEGFGLLFAKLSRIPVVVRLHTSSKEAQIIDGTRPSRLHQWDVRRERWLARSADAVVTHSAAHRQLMADESGIAPDRIHLIPHGVEVFPDWVRPTRPLGPPTVVYLGRLEHRKGTLELLQSVPRVLEAVPDARFILIGSDRNHCPGGRTHAQYLDQEFAPEIRRQVTLTGQLSQAEVDRWLQTADVFVAPSRYESFGLVFLEAMRWGTPVIGTTAGGIPEVVEHNQTGLLVPPEAPGPLAAAIVRLLSDSVFAATLGESARRRAEEEFSVERMARRVAALYDEVIRSKHAVPDSGSEVVPTGKPPLVSVVIPTYNYARYVGEAVESALAQTYPAVEVIVVDDGSTDDTRERLAKYGDRIRYIYQDNAGLSAARNTGILAATGSFVAFLDSDDAFHPKKLELQVRLLLSDPSLGLISTQSYSDEPVVWKDILPETVPSRCITLKQKVLSTRFAPSSVIVRRECFDRIGLFDTSLRSAEDRDMWIRIAAQYPMARLDCPLTWYRITPGSMSQNPERMERFERLVLDKAFAMPKLAGKAGLRRKALGLASYSGAWMYYSSGRPQVALRRLLRSFLWWPFPYWKPDVRAPFARLRLLLATLRRLFFGTRRPAEIVGRT